MTRLLLVGMAWLATGCFNPGDCIINNRTTIELEFVGTDGKPAAAQFQSISISGRPGTILSAVNRANVSLPVNPGADSTTFVFVRPGSPNPAAVRKDSITFTYRNQVLVLNPDCGAILYHRDLNFTINTFGSESLRITNRQLLTTVSRNATLRP
jgi:hypothetical protein